MRLPWNNQRWAALVLATTLLVGCGQGEGDLPTASAPAPTAEASVPPEVDASGAKPNDSAAPDPIEVTPTKAESPQEGEDEPDAAAPAAETPALADYKAPYPDRVELFVPPKRQGGARSPGSEDQDAVELLGFVKVDRAKVVLSINGQVTPVAEGDTQLGVEVISIQPPTVVLQRGRQRWSASLEN